MEGRKTRIKMLILNVLRDSGKPVGSSHIMDELRYAGQYMSERAIRMYLKELDDEGLTTKIGRKGRSISETGLREIESSKILERVPICYTQRCNPRVTSAEVNVRVHIITTKSIIKPHR